MAGKVSSAGSGLKEQLSGLSRASMSSVKSLGRRSVVLFKTYSKFHSLYPISTPVQDIFCKSPEEGSSPPHLASPGWTIKVADTLTCCRHSDDSDDAAEEPTTPRGSSVTASEGDAVKASCLPVSCLASSKKLA